MLEAFDRQPPSWARRRGRAAVREMQTAWTRTSGEDAPVLRAGHDDPGVRPGPGRLLPHYRDDGEAMAKRAGRSPDDVAVRARGRDFGVIISVTMPWETTRRAPERGLFRLMDGPGRAGERPAVERQVPEEWRLIGEGRSGGERMRLEAQLTASVGDTGRAPGPAGAQGCTSSLAEC